MRRFILIGICLCASVILFSQQSFAATLMDMSPSVFASTFEQTGTFSLTTSNLPITTTNWPNPAFNSWYFNGIGGTASTVVSGTPSDYYTTITYTGGIGTLDFYYGGTEYTTSGSGTTTSILHFLNGTFVPLGSSMEIIGASYPLPIDLASNGKFTGFYFNNGDIKGDIMCYFSLTHLYSGHLTSATGSITGSAVPIPGAIWLLGSGLVGLVGIRRRFKS